MKRIPPGELPYEVEAVDIVIELPDLVISEITLSPGQKVPWHYHNKVTDIFYCLSGCTFIRHGESAEARLQPGESISVPPRTPHQVECAVDASYRFLIIQGLGEYDYVPAGPPSEKTDA